LTSDLNNIQYCIVGWVDIGIGTKVPLRFVTYLSKVKKINEKSLSKDAEFYVDFKNITLP
jgi:hypothetical protein